MNDILGVSSLVQWETVLPRFVEVPLSGTDKPADAAVIISKALYSLIGK